MAKRLQRLFEEYSESHQHPVNVKVHWLAVPVIFFSILGLLHEIPGVPVPGLGEDGLRAVTVAVVAVLLYYVVHSFSLALGMGLFTFACLLLAHEIGAHSPLPLWAVCAALFALAWVAQFLGHGVEGKKPSFLKDLQFLLIGPAWLLAKIYRRLGIPY